MQHIPLLLFHTHTHTHYTPPYLMHTTHRNIVFKAPYPVQEQPQEVLHTYLDTVGRPVFIATKSNLVEQHIVDFEVGNRSAPNLMCPTPTFMSLPSCPYLHVPTFMSLPSCPYLHVPTFMSLSSCPYLHHVPTFMSLPSCPYLHVPTFMSLPSCPYLHVPTFMSLPSCPYLHVPTFMSLPSCPYLTALTAPLRF